jgi:hypothetical protein
MTTTLVRINLKEANLFFLLRLISTTTTTVSIIRKHDKSYFLFRECERESHPTG